MIAFLTGTTNRQLGEEIAALLHVPALTIHRETFRDGETYIRLPSIQKKDVVVLQSGSPNANDAFIDLLFMLDAVFRGKPRSVSVLLSFSPYRRQERQDVLGAAVGAAVVGRCLSSYPLRRIFCVQPHVQSFRSFFRVPFTVIPTLPLFAHHFSFLKNNAQWTVAAPDEGSAVFSRSLATALHLPLVVMKKRRNGHDSIDRVTIARGNVQKKNVLLLDDEINTGGTMIENANVLRKRGCREIVVAATHPVFSGDATIRLQRSLISRITVTNTIALPSAKRFPKLERLSIAPFLADVLRSVVL